MVALAEPLVQEATVRNACHGRKSLMLLSLLLGLGFAVFVGGVHHPMVEESTIGMAQQFMKSAVGRVPAMAPMARQFPQPGMAPQLPELARVQQFSNLPKAQQFMQPAGQSMRAYPSKQAFIPQVRASAPKVQIAVESTASERPLWSFDEIQSILSEYGPTKLISDVEEAPTGEEMDFVEPTSVATFETEIEDEDASPSYLIQQIKKWTRSKQVGFLKVYEVGSDFKER